jgi:hypothetical protein
MAQLATDAPDTARGLILGTVQYMSPEQVEGKDPAAPGRAWASCHLVAARGAEAPARQRAHEMQEVFRRGVDRAGAGENPRFL